jgi:hypothetical protein
MSVSTVIHVCPNVADEAFRWTVLTQDDLEEERALREEGSSFQFALSEPMVSYEVKGLIGCDLLLFAAGVADFFNRYCSGFHDEDGWCDALVDFEDFASNSNVMALAL